MTMALSHCELRAEFLAGQQNRILDALNRWHLNNKHQSLFWELTKKFGNKKQCMVSEDMRKFVIQ